MSFSRKVGLGWGRLAGPTESCAGVPVLVGGETVPGSGAQTGPGPCFQDPTHGWALLPTGSFFLDPAVSPYWPRRVCSRQASVREDGPCFPEGSRARAHRSLAGLFSPPFLLVRLVHLLMIISNQNSMNNIVNPANKMQSLHPQSHQPGTCVCSELPGDRGPGRGTGRTSARRAAQRGSCLAHG